MTLRTFGGCLSPQNFSGHAFWAPNFQDESTPLSRTCCFLLDPVITEAEFFCQITQGVQYAIYHRFIGIWQPKAGLNILYLLYARPIYIGYLPNCCQTFSVIQLKRTYRPDRIYLTLLQVTNVHTVTVWRRRVRSLVLGWVTISVHRPLSSHMSQVIPLQ